LPTITEQQKVGLHSLPQQMYVVWAEESLAQASVQACQCGLTKPAPVVSMHTDSISNSAIVSNDYVLLLSILCTCVQ